MATEVKLPRLGQGMEAGTIVKWLKAEGEPVEKGEPLYELDTDKVTQEVEAEASGVLLKIAISEGEVAVGKTIAFIGEEGEKVEAPAKGREDGDTARAAREPRERAEREEAPKEPEPQQVPAPRRDGAPARVKASPLARRIARERDIDLASVTGTGPEGRVVAEDVERAAAAPVPAPAAAPAPAAEAEVVKLSSMRRTIARRMTEAWQAPAFQLEVSVDMTAALALRARLKERVGEQPTPTVSDVLTKLAAVALMRHRDVNATWADDAVELHPSANVGIAVALAGGGLVVPVIRGCERLSIAEIAAARSEVVQRAREGKLRQEDLEGGTFTISNLGMYGIDRFTAVLNPPQAAILAVGTAEERAVVVDGELAVRSQMDLVLTCDHRQLTGATAAEFLATLKALLEEPALAL
jgi:pyruvate dehydrogenase E2 component (dihydrolipoamide acetyltransferase)